MGKEKTKVYVCFCPSDCEKRKYELIQVLEKAGLEVIGNEKGFHEKEQEQGPEKQLTRISNLITYANCAILLLGKEFGNPFSGNKTLTELQFEKCVSQIRIQKDFRIFIWQLPEYSQQITDERQTNLIRKLRNNIEEGISYLLTGYVLQLVEDIREMMKPKIIKKFDTKESGIFIVYNEMDKDEGQQIVTKLTPDGNIVNLNVSQDSGLDYGGFTLEQMRKCQILVVYYRESYIWAVSFVKQIWKMSGGATSKIPIVVIGEIVNPEINYKKILIPNVQHNEVPQGQAAMIIKDTFHR